MRAVGGISAGGQSAASKFGASWTPMFSPSRNSASPMARQKSNDSAVAGLAARTLFAAGSHPMGLGSFAGPDAALGLNLAGDGRETNTRVRLERPALRPAEERGDVRQGTRARIDEIARGHDAFNLPRLHALAAAQPAPPPRRHETFPVERRGEFGGGRERRGLGLEEEFHDRSEAGQGCGPDGAAAWTAEERGLAWRDIFSG